MDIDKFKSINDVYGHPSGDSVLLFVASFLKDIFPPDSFIGRIGGDEFSILVKDASDKAKIRKMAKAVAEQGKLFKLPFTCSVGVMIFNETQTDFVSCYDKVDHLLYDSKNMRDGNIAIK